jgi:hypothetical protein
MYLTKEQIEVRILEALDDTIFYNGKRLDEILPVEERALICVNIVENLPNTMPDLIKKYHKDRDLKENVSLKSIYFHLLEEVFELGLELNISTREVYIGFFERFTEILKRKDKNSTKEGLINELADVSTVIGSIAEYVNMGELLYDAILIVRDSNDTKICSLEEVKQTIKEKGLSNSSVRTKNLGNDKYLMIDEVTGKSVKPVGYKPPDFKHLFK